MMPHLPISRFLAVLGGRGRRRAYFAADERGAQALRVLARSHSAGERAEALVQLVAVEQECAEAAAGFASADRRDEDGLTLAETHAGAARAVQLVANTELFLSLGRPYRPGGDALLEHLPGVPPLLCELTVTDLPFARAELIVSLSDVVVDELGGQAAESLVAVAIAYYELAGLTRGEARRQIISRYDGDLDEEG